MSLPPGVTLMKDPNAVLVYAFDWTAWLGATAVIMTSTWSIVTTDASATTLVKDTPVIVAGNQITQIRISAGTLGQKYQVTNQIVTNETPSQTDERSVFLEVENI